LTLKKFFLNQKNPHRAKFLRSLTVTLEQGISFKEGVKTFYILMQGSFNPLPKVSHPKIFGSGDSEIFGDTSPFARFIQT
jgi:hypothetical protein